MCSMLKQQFEKERNMEFAERFVRLCNDMLTGGVAACGCFWILRLFRDGIIVNIFYQVADTCGDSPTFTYSGIVPFILKSLLLVVCNVTLCVAAIVVILSALLLPLCAYVLFKIRDFLPLKFALLIPEIRGHEITLLGIGLGLMFGGVGALAVNFVKGNWLLWWTIWFVWVAIFIVFYIQNKEFGPKIMPKPKRLIGLVFAMVILFPAGMSYFVV